ncbi:hypothetical protein [Campylobacter concisus]|uniref:hypothetical protein n=1 Tax=Campylobacter concisus TaxID=199 RepID=UPI001CB81AD3|nr:hypothetical protein [Campylobacter concisus]
MRTKTVFVKRKLLYKFLVTASDQINLLIKPKFTNLKRQNQKTKSSLYKFTSAKP